MKELYDQYVKKVVHIELGGLRVAVVVLDVKKSYGKVRFLVSPVRGTGEVWTEKILDY
jgi:hypothetical protein